MSALSRCILFERASSLLSKGVKLLANLSHHLPGFAAQLGGFFFTAIAKIFHFGFHLVKVFLDIFPGIANLHLAKIELNFYLISKLMELIVLFLKRFFFSHR